MNKNKVKVQRKVLLLISIMLFSGIAGFFSIENCRATGNTIYVDSGGGGNYTTIQAAIDAAANGDTIYVYNGFYNENVEITKDITLTGQNKESTIIDGGKNDHVVYAYGSSGDEIEISISGFTVRNAGGTGNDCIALSYVHSGSIFDNKILNSDKSDGIQLDHSSNITINDNQISGNAAAAISLTRSENNILSGNVIQNNQKGIYFYDMSSSNTVNSNTITGNSQYGIHIQISYYQSQNNLFYMNDFTTNGQHAQDPYSNQWSFNSQGNYWSDYNDYDSDENGIGDSPYEIPGGGSQDQFPLGYFLEPEPGTENQRPIAYQPTIYPNPAEYGESISFSGSGSDNDGYIAGYNWRSNIDGQLSTSKEFSTSSLSIGSHIIYFKVKDNEEYWSSEKTASLIINEVEDEQDPVNLSENQEPVAVIDSITPNPAEYKTKVTLSGHGTDEDGYIIGWKWISSIDGVIGETKTINTSELSLGTHTIYFQVRDNASEWSKQVTESLIINLDPTNKAPIAHIGGTYVGAINEDIIFDGSESYDEDGEIVEYLWDLGDGTTLTGESVLHSYSLEGNYTVTLTVTDDDQGVSTMTCTATILEVTSSYRSTDSFEFEIPIHFVVIGALSCVGAGIVMFLFWIKRV